jgi:hypothetical protein
MVRLFRERPDRVSLVVHGNDHSHRELAQPATAEERRAKLAQALRRIEAFERRFGVPVSRVMVAPHGVCSEEMARDLVPAGFEALCISRPYPWLAVPPHPWLKRPAGASALTGWEPASMVANRLPVLLRRPFGESVEELALRAFLDQPLILYGHHGDMEDGLERLAEVAAAVHGIGEVDWMSPGDIAMSNLTTRREGDVLRTRMFSRHARIPIPAGVRQLLVEAPGLDAGSSWSTVMGVPEDVESMELWLRCPSADDAADLALPAPQPWPVARRVMSEGRDRLVPVYRRTVRRVRRAA